MRNGREKLFERRGISGCREKVRGKGKEWVEEEEEEEEYKGWKGMRR